MHILVPLIPFLILLAGCAETPADDAGDQLPDGSGGDDDVLDPGNGFAPQQGHDEASDPSVPGVTVTGDMFACEGGFCVNATAQNGADDTYYVSSICVSPWSDGMQRDGQDVQHVEPRAHCLAFGTQPFAPGDISKASYAWNTTVWDDAGYRPADQGAYQWTISFQLFETADGDGRHDLELGFTVIVGAT